MVNLVAALFFGLLLAYGIYGMWDSAQINKQADASLYETYKPTAKDSLSFAELQKINSDVFGWLTVDKTHINYPLVQTEDNAKYVNTDVKGQFSLAGSIFLDCNNKKDFSDINNIIYGHHMAKDAMFGEKYVNTDVKGQFSLAGSIFLDCNNKKDFSDINNIIYGHHMAKDAMFGELEYFEELKGQFSLAGSIFLDCNNKKDFSDINNIIYGHHMAKDAMFGELEYFEEPKYFEEHSYGKLYYDGEWHKVEFFAFVHADAYDNVLYNTSSNNRLEYLDYVKEHAKYLKKTSFDDNERYVTLSTCTSESTNGRHLLIGRILENTADEKKEHAKYLKKTSFDDNERYVTLSTCTSESTNGRHLLIGRILENTADEKGEPQYEEK